MSYRKPSTKLHTGKIRDAAVLVLFAALLVSPIWAQDDSQQSSTGAPPAATGPAQTNVENPPLSGLDAPSAEPAFGGRSYLVPGAQLSESVDSFSGSGAGNGAGTSEISRAMVSVDMQKIWKASQFALDYLGGGAYFTGRKQAGQNRAYQVHAMAANERLLWRTGQMTIRDAFDYLPEGTFGFGSFGGAGAFSGAMGGGQGVGTGLGGGIGGGTQTGYLSSGAFGSFGFQPRIDNSSIVDIAQMLSPRTSVTLAGGYDLSHFFNNNPQQAFNAINSQLLTAQAGYNHLLSAKDQVGLLYAFQEIHFPVAGSGTVEAHIWNGLYGHRISGRLNFTAGGGPEVVILHFPGSSTSSVGMTARTGLTYTASIRTNAQIMYTRALTPGSGFFAGATTNAVRTSVNHVLGRTWTSMLDVGYSHNRRLQQVTTGGIGSKVYEYWYAGGSITKKFGPHFGVFASYQFDRITTGACTGGLLCSARTNQHIGMIGLNWHPRPLRLD